MTIFFCAAEARRQAVREAVDDQGNAFVNGMDFVEVVPGSGQRTLELHFIHPLPGQSDAVPAAPVLGTANFKIRRQPSHTGQNVVAVDAVAVQENIATLSLDAAGDFAFYDLLLVANENTDSPPSGFDPQLASLRFSFKAACPSDADCRELSICDDKTESSPYIDYRARDFESFNRVLTDRLRQLLPRWRGDSPVDQTAALVDLLSYVGDHLNYQLDWVGTQSYLDTALERVAIGRHARLRNFWMHEGNNARSWISIDVHGLVTVPFGTRIVAGAPDQHQLASAGKFDSLDPRRSAVFETMHSLPLDPALNRLSVYTWGAEECVLCAGSTSVTLYDPGVPLQDFLLLEQVLDPQRADGASLTGYRDGQRWVVRVRSVQPEIDAVTGDALIRVTWDKGDALPFSLCVSSRIGDDVIDDVTIARGNIMLADHGLSIESIVTDPDVQVPITTDVEQRIESQRRGLSPYQAPAKGPYRPAVQSRLNPITRAAAWDQSGSASSALLQRSDMAEPQLSLRSRSGIWQSTSDILEHDENDRVFVPETDNNGVAHLRFGIGGHGQLPEPLEAFVANGRVGNGIAGNVGVESLTTMVLPGAPILRVRNPLPATGGVDPEDVERVKRFAPVAFRQQQRAVTLQDYVDRALQFPGVQDAYATFRWMASWYTVVISIDRLGGQVISESFRADFLAHINQYRLMGYDVRLRDPIRVPLDIELHICLSNGADRAVVEIELARSFGSQKGGLFHPDNIGFGYTLFASQIIDAALKIDGVLDAVLTKFQRFGQAPDGELADGRITAREHEVIELLQDPSAPGRGRMRWQFDQALQEVAP